MFCGRPDTEEIKQLDIETNSLSEQGRILNQVMKRGYLKGYQIEKFAYTVITVKIA